MIPVAPIVLALVPVIMGLVQLAKQYINERYAPLMSLVLGVAGSLALHTSTITMDILAGLIIGLMCCGLYSGAKATMDA